MAGLVAGLVIRECGPEAAAVVHALMLAAFAEYGVLDPPSGALRETVESVADELREHGGLLASADDVPAGSLRFSRREGALFVRRVAVRPDLQRGGLGRALMVAAEEHARSRGEPEVRLGVRAVLTGNRAFYARLGYRELADHGFWIELGKGLA